MCLCHSDCSALKIRVHTLDRKPMTVPLGHTYPWMHQINSKLNSQNLLTQEQIYSPQQDIFPVYPI